jgi:hypothetical protein
MGGAADVEGTSRKLGRFAIAAANRTAAKKITMPAANASPGRGFTRKMLPPTTTSSSSAPKDQADGENGEQADTGGHPHQVVELDPVESMKISHRPSITRSRGGEAKTLFGDRPWSIGRRDWAALSQEDCRKPLLLVRPLSTVTDATAAALPSASQRATTYRLLSGRSLVQIQPGAPFYQRPRRSSGLGKHPVSTHSSGRAPARR